MLIWPLFYSSHYALVVINLKRREMNCYDSLRTHATLAWTAALDHVRALVMESTKVALKPAVLKMCKQQPRGTNDCGLHVINNALSIITPGTNKGHDRSTLRKMVRGCNEETW
mmetsp:Transcript_68067/g.79178  ORF Transcript_68067/g.79178 Transcript_68067/m.79178 type:complete len:113 (+) Transcript_68067:128-466(+)